MRYLTAVKKIILYLFSLSVVTSTAQELPPIVQYLPESYGGDTQNWSISQAKNNYVYVANNQGLLEFNGTSWRLYESPNETIIRSVHVVEDRIYTGCYMNFGFWEKDAYGQLIYTSISQAIAARLIEDEQFWHIVNVGDRVLFQSLNRVYVYDSNTHEISIIKPDSAVLGIYNVNGIIYYQDVKNGIYSIENGSPKLVVAMTSDLGTIIDISEIPGGIRVLTNTSGFYESRMGKLTKWDIEADAFLKNATLYSGVQLRDGGYVLGTISKGLIYVLEDGSIAYQITQSKGLSNNTVLSLFEDNDENIWLALDHGINCLNIKSPVQIFNDEQHTIGTTYAAALFDDNLYLGTNQGLFCKKVNSHDQLKFIKGTEGQVWSLFEYDDNLFCGHNSGTFLIKNDTSRLISKLPGVWNFVTVPEHPDWLLQGTYSGINLLAKIRGQWQLKHQLDGFDYSAKFLEWYQHELWVNHEYKGVFRIKTDDNFKKVTQVVRDTTMSEKKGSGLLLFSDRMLFAHGDGVFYYNTVAHRFLKDTVLSKIYDNKGYVSGRIIEDGRGRLWGFSKQDISYVSQDQFSDQLQVTEVAIPSSLRKGMIGYENIRHLGSNLYLLGNSGGYIILNLDRISTQKYPVVLDQVAIREKESAYTRVLVQSADNDMVFKPDSNTISFTYTVPEYDNYLVSKFQYKLEGFYEGWSDWSTTGAVVFENLPYGAYTFMVRAKVGNELSENTVSYTFRIARPWYLSNSAIVAYGLVILVILLVVHRAYKKHYTKQKLKLVRANEKQLELKSMESERVIMKLNNEKLLQDIESKNRELASSTISIIKKNEILNTIKKELVNPKSEQQAIKNVEKIIDRNLKNEDDWRYFEEAFNNVDKDFLKKLKGIHDNLTPHDLRFCTYLRLNLSSKEIAPLLNISVRSVEIKRYRLRKKLNLVHKQSLVNYILDI